MKERELHSALTNLNANRDPNIWDRQTFGQAPHKPFLLLSVMDGIEIGWIGGPQVELSQDLIETFFGYWNRIMGEDRKTTIALPFFHMHSEPFWELQYRPGEQPYANSPSLGGLMERVAFARLDGPLFEMMRDGEQRRMLADTIFVTYFAPELHDTLRSIRRVNVGAYHYARQLELMAAEPFVKYHRQWDDDNDKAGHYTLQKMQKRQQGFGLQIRRSYGNRCAVCRARVTTPGGASIVEGAHIIPWSESKNDDPRNGLALCKTHHWMFDGYLLAVRPDYRILCSPWLRDNGEGVDATLALHNTEIMIPDEERFMPNEGALEDRHERYKEAG